MYLSIRNAMYEKPTINIILNGEKPKAFPVRSEKDKDAHSCHFYSVDYWKPSLGQLGKKKIEKVSK